MAQTKSSNAHGRPPSDQTVPKTQKLAYSIAEFAEMAGIGRSLLYEEIAKGNLRVRKVGRRTLILHDDGKVYLYSLPVRDLTSSSEKG